MERKLTYKETREKIHEILFNFLDRELECSKVIEFRTDDILKLIQNQGGGYL